MSPNTENWTDQEKANCKEVLEKALDEIRKRFIKEFELRPGSGELPPGVHSDLIQGKFLIFALGMTEYS